jgi:hemolysin activation/secretion protein
MPHSPKRTLSRYLLASCLAVVVLPRSGEVAAQAIPSDFDQQQLLLQQERERVQRERLESRPDVRLEAPAQDAGQRLPENEAPCFRIDDIQLVGERAEDFQWALRAANPSSDPALGRCLGGRGINLTIARIQDAVVARGFITTRVLAESQDLNSGKLVLTVIPGVIDAIRIAPGSSPLVSVWNALPAAPGELLNLRDIEQGLENLKRAPTADADIQIEPARRERAGPGASDLVIQWRQRFPARLSLSLDDSGSDSTGKYQGSIAVSLDHLWHANDLFYASYSHDLGGGNPGDKGTEGHSLHYSVPFGYWTLAASLNVYDYFQSVVGANQTYRYSGESENAEIKLSRILYRDAARKTQMALTGWERASKNHIDDTEILVQRRRMAGWELSFGHREYLGSAVFDVGLNYKRGTGARGSLPAPEELFDEGTAQPTIISAHAQLSYPFALGDWRLRYQPSWRAQWNRTRLIPQDRFSIGGRHTVRGFDGENILSAERGWLVRQELALALGRTGQEVFWGVDHGQVSGPTAEKLIGTHLTGVALGLRGGYRDLSYECFVAAPLDKPRQFATADVTGGFNLNWSY